MSRLGECEWCEWCGGEGVGGSGGCSLFGCVGGQVGVRGRGLGV